MSFRNFAARLTRFVKPDATDENWDYYGEKCAYYGVVNWPQFKPENLTDDTRQEFFRTGEQYIERLYDTIRSTVAPDFQPRSAVDFGCGVGRLVVPLAKKGASVAGIDISPGMREEAKRNCELQGLAKVTFHPDVDELIGQERKFEFIHSFIVFQHIRPERGCEIFKKLVNVLEDGGVGSIHFTYFDPGAFRDRVKRWLYRKVPLLWAIKNLTEGRPFTEPMADMADYPLNRIFRILQEQGCDLCATRFSRHGSLGILVIFKKEQIEAF